MDDVALANKTHLVLQDQKQAWHDRLKDNGMRLNIQKTKYLECGPNKSTQLKYLG